MPAQEQEPEPPVPYLPGTRVFFKIPGPYSGESCVNPEIPGTVDDVIMPDASMYDVCIPGSFRKAFALDGAYVIRTDWGGTYQVSPQFVRKLDY